MGKDLRGKELGKGIAQRKDGLYTGRYKSKSGKTVQKYFKKLQDCKKWYADAVYTDEHSILGSADSYTVETWYKYWIGIKEITVRRNTVRNYRERYERNIRPIIGQMTLSDVKPMHCQRVFTVMAEQGYKSTTMYQTRISLYNMLEFAKENEVLQSNPCKKTVKSDIGKPSAKKEALTIPQQKLFLEHAYHCAYDLQYRFVLQTGLRVGELVGLQWGDIDFTAKTMKIQRTVEFRHSTGEWMIGPPKTKSGYRTIPLTEEAITILRMQRIKNKTVKVFDLQWKDFVFLSKKGQPVKNSTYDTGIYKVCRWADLKPFGMHVLRHTFATRCIEGGMKPKTLQVILGHSNINITMNLYVHVTEEEKHSEMVCIESSLKIV